eukprot:166298-Amphidinium_carterae.1
MLYVQTARLSQEPKEKCPLDVLDLLAVELTLVIRTWLQSVCNAHTIALLGHLTQVGWRGTRR